MFVDILMWWLGAFVFQSRSAPIVYSLSHYRPYTMSTIHRAGFYAGKIDRILFLSHILGIASFFFFR